MSAQAKTETQSQPGQAPPPSANDAKLPAGGTAQAGVPAQAAANDDDKPDHSTNLIRRTVDEVCGLMAEVHDIREEMLAHGIQFHMINALSEMGVNDKHEEQAKLITTALETSVKAHGPQAIERQELEDHLAALVVLEKDLRHVRQVAKQQGVNMQAFNNLTQLMRLNPGDGGVQAINTFIAYADASGVPLDRMDAIRAQFEDGPKSVLPEIAREKAMDARDRIRILLQNVMVGLMLTALAMWLVL